MIRARDRRTNQPRQKPKMKTRKTVRYFIRIQGEYSSFSPSGWSGYSKRLVQRDRLKTAKERNSFEVYGPEQCAAHIAELRRHEWHGRKLYARATFEIVREVTTQKVIAATDVS